MVQLLHTQATSPPIYPNETIANTPIWTYCSTCMVRTDHSLDEENRLQCESCSKRKQHKGDANS